MALRLIFMGTPDFAVPSLSALIDAGHDVAQVYTRPPRQTGRGKHARPTPVHEAATRLGIAVRTPETLRAEEEHRFLTSLNPDAITVVAYGVLLPRPVLGIPQLGCLNVHASLLPRWRGSAPIQRALMAGDTESGVSIMLMDEGLDTGPVYLQRRIPVSPDETAGSLHDRLAQLGAESIVESLSKLPEGALKPTVQSEDDATYARKIERSEREIDWQRSADEIDCQIRALAPAPGAWFSHDGERIKVFACTKMNESSGMPGEILDDLLTVACGDGALRLDRIQRESRRAMDAHAFLRGQSLPTGIRLS